MARGRQRQLKQVWFTEHDEQRFQAVAQALERAGYDVKPDSRKAQEPYSHTKVIRILLEYAERTLDTT